MEKEWKVLSEGQKRLRDETIEEYILRLRGIKDPQHFLNPVPEDLLPLTDLKNIDKAAQVVVDGIKNHKRFTVFMDVDSDGASSGTIIYKYLEQFQCNLNWIINKGKIHGLSGQNSEDIIETTDILICCDSSSDNYDEHKYLSDHNVQVVVLDHHPFSESKDAVVVNSSYGGYKNPELSGSGVCWKFTKYLDGLLGENIADTLADLACVGIISDNCDVSEKALENRYICSLGFHNLNNVGLKTIVGTYDFDGSCVGWSISPLLNTCMRTNNNELAVELLLETKKSNCTKIIKQIKEIKKDEDEKKKSIVNDLIFQIKNNLTDNDKVISVLIPKGEAAGIIAQSLVNEFKRSVIVLHELDEDDTVYDGSMRGYGLKSFESVINSTKLAKVKGHPNAAGIFVNKEDYEPLIKALNEKLKDVKILIKEDVDIELLPEEVYYSLIEGLVKINLITGKGHKAVNVAMQDIEVKDLIQMKPNHLKWISSGLEFVFWKSADKIEDLKCDPGETYRVVDLMGKLQIGNFRGKKSLQFVVKDYKNSREELEFLRDI